MANEHVLLVEDNDIDALLFQQALRAARPEATLYRVQDVLSAVYYLRGIGFFADRTAHPIPYLVVIDLNLASVDGMELLKWIQQDPAMKQRLITLIYTSSTEPKDSETAFALGATSFLLKPNERGALVTSLNLLHENWQALNLLPPAGTPPGEVPA
jgi:CheY-like chemotaxis protein